MKQDYKFSFGPWNISEGEDPFGPPVRKAFAHADKFAYYRKLGFEGVQFHDDDVVLDIDSKSPAQIDKEVAEMKKVLDGEGLTAEFVAPRLWFAEQTIDGAITSNRASDRQYAKDRIAKTVDICKALDSKSLVFWFAREGSYIRESKNAMLSYERLLGAINDVLAQDSEIEVWIEPKPNEPCDQTYCPTVGHVVGLSYASNDHSRVKVMMETAHAQLAGLDPSDEMGFALAHNKLASIHLNDQNGLKFDQDKNFGSANLRAAFNQVRILELANYGSNGEFVGLDVKAMRTQAGFPVTSHLVNSKKTFEHMVEKVRTWDKNLEQQFVDARDYEALEQAILEHIMGIK